MDRQVATSVTTQRRIPGQDLVVPALAVVGVLFVLYQLWGYVGWALDGGATRFTTDATIPGSVRSGVELGQVLMPLLTIGWLAFVVRGVVRARSLTWPLGLTLVWGLTYWQESLANVTGPRFAYNAHFADLGDWTTSLPFLGGSGPGLPQPLVMEPAVFLGLLPLISWTVAGAIRRLQARTGWSPWFAAGLVYVGVLVLELGAELRSISQGVHSYPEVFGALSIRDGAPDQFPLYENWLLGLMWFLPGLAIYLLRNRPTPTLSPTLVLAGVGALNIAFLLYNLIAFVWLPADTTAPMPPWLNP